MTAVFSNGGMAIIGCAVGSLTISSIFFSRNKIIRHRLKRRNGYSSGGYGCIVVSDEVLSSPSPRCERWRLVGPFFFVVVRLYRLDRQGDSARRFSDCIRPVQPLVSCLSERDTCRLFQISTSDTFLSFRLRRHQLESVSLPDESWNACVRPPFFLLFIFLQLMSLCRDFWRGEKTERRRRSTGIQFFIRQVSSIKWNGLFIGKKKK